LSFQKVKRKLNFIN